MMFLQPLHQGAAGVQRDPQIGVRFEHVQKRSIAVLVGLFEDILKVADRLVIVEYETQADGIAHGDGARPCVRDSQRVASFPAPRVTQGRRVDRPGAQQQLPQGIRY